MAILIFTTDYKPARGSGIANFTFFLASQWSFINEEIIVLAPKTKGYCDFDRRQTFKTHRFSNILLWREIYCFCLILFLRRKHRIQTIINMLWLPCGVLSYTLKLLVNIPYHIVVYGADIAPKVTAHPSLKHKIRASMKSIKRKVFEKSEQVFAISEYTKQLLLNYDVPEHKIKVIYPACAPFNIFHPALDRQAIRKKYCTENKKLILSVGRMDFYKGHDFVIKALSSLKDKTFPFHYVIVGNGQEKENLQNLVRTLHMDGDVSFAGEVSDAELPLYYAACDLFVFPSLEMEDAGEMEGFGIVLVEAMACQKPVISGISGGTREVVVHEKTGLLVDANDTQALADAIKRMLSDETFAQKMAENGYRRAREVFDGEKIVKTALEEIKKYS